MPKHTRLPVNPVLKSLARDLRKHSTLGEVLLWQRIKGGQRAGCDFHRQKPVDEYILDFFCPELMLAIAIDGGSHRLKEVDDENRQRRLESLGINFLRIEEKMVRRNLDGVLGEIDRLIAIRRRHPPPCGHPSREGIRG